MIGRGRDWIPLALAAVTSLLHLLTAQDSYGIFRDELYYVACSRNLDWGYVDHPPLAALLTLVSRSVLGESLTALRFLPAVAAGVTVLLASRLAREMGGDPFSGVMAGVATMLAPAYVANFGFLSMNAYDVMLWAAALLVFARLLRTDDPRYWIPFGAVAGIGLQNKISMLFLGFGLVAGLVLARRWGLLRSIKAWIGGAIAFAIFLPHLLWQWIHGWPTLEFMENATQTKNLPLEPLEFLSAQAWMMNPIVVPLGLGGLGFLLLGKPGKPFRALGWAVLVVLALMIFQRAKAYYFSPAYTLLFASGSVALAGLAKRGRLGWVREAAVTLVVATGVVQAPLAKPLLPVEAYVAYAEALGIAASTSERKELGRLPQFFADRLGWRKLAETVGEISRALPAADREQVCVYGQNYGHAGAIDFWAVELDLPPAISGHNSYHLWGPRGCTGEIVIVIDGSRESLERRFESVELATTYTCEDCMPYENDKPIWVCRGMREPLSEVWPQLAHYD